MTPNRRQSLHQLNSSPNASSVVVRPSPTQSPAGTIISLGPTAGTEFNTTLVGSNNISLNKVSKIESDSLLNR